MPALRSQTKATRTARRSAVKLVPAVPEEYIPSVRDFESQSSYDDEQPEKIEEPWSYVFQVRSSYVMHSETILIPTPLLSVETTCG